MHLSGLPHSADNIHWVCKRVNLGKSKFSNEEFRVWAKAPFRRIGRPSSPQDINHSRNEDTEEEEKDEEEEEWEEAEAEEEWEEEEKEQSNMRHLICRGMWPPFLNTAEARSHLMEFVTFVHNRVQANGAFVLTLDPSNQQILTAPIHRRCSVCTDKEAGTWLNVSYADYVHKEVLEARELMREMGAGRLAPEDLKNIKDVPAVAIGHTKGKELQVQLNVTQSFMKTAVELRQMQPLTTERQH
jgi:hypothetical protein